MPSQAQKLRDLINRGEHFIVADAYSALTARIVERVGFKAAYLGGHACSAFHYAVPDNGIFSQVEQLEQAARIAAAVDIPLIVDADTLGERSRTPFISPAATSAPALQVFTWRTKSIRSTRPMRVHYVNCRYAGQARGMRQGAAGSGIRDHRPLR